jgi:hypothetical protein
MIQLGAPYARVWDSLLKLGLVGVGKRDERFSMVELTSRSSERAAAAHGTRPSAAF